MEISLERGFECVVNLVFILVVYVLIFLAVHPWIVGLLYLINGAQFLAKNYSVIMIISVVVALMALIALIGNTEEGEKDVD